MKELSGAINWGQLSGGGSYLEGNYPGIIGRQLFRRQLSGAILLEGQLSRGQLFGGKLSWGGGGAYFLGRNCPWGSCLGGNCPGDNFPRTKSTDNSLVCLFAVIMNFFFHSSISFEKWKHMSERKLFILLMYAIIVEQSESVQTFS